MDDDQVKKLNDLRGEIFNELTAMADTLVENSDAGVDVLLMLAQNSPDLSLLEKAHKKAIALENPSEKADALLAVLDEIEVRLQAGATPELNDGQSVEKVMSESDPLEAKAPQEIEVKSADSAS